MHSIPPCINLLPSHEFCGPIPVFFPAFAGADTPTLGFPAAAMFPDVEIARSNEEEETVVVEEEEE